MGYEGSGHGLALGDYDADGDIDIFVVNKAGTNILYRNNGDGTFTDITQQAGFRDIGSGHGAAFLDYDNDGDLDIYVANWEGQWAPNNLYRNDGNDTFAKVNDISGIASYRRGASHGCTVGDFDGDGFIDIFASSAEEICILLRNRGDGTFEDYSERSGMRVGPRPHFQSTLDYDNDGDLDIMVSNSDPDDGDADAPNQLYRNSGLGTFSEVASSVGLSRGDLHGACFADFNRDGYLDLFAPDCARGSRLNLLLNVRGKKFKDATARSGTWHTPQRTHAMVCGDFDNDGDLDALLTSAGGHLLFANSGSATFVEVAQAVGLGESLGDPKAVGFLDYDNDGDLDIYFVFSDAPNRLFRNEGTRGNWLKLRLVGSKSSRDAVGARIEVRCEDWVQTMEICGGRGHIQDPFEQFVGLGTATHVESITVRWPSGQRSVLEKVEANQRVVLTEPG